MSALAAAPLVETLAEWERQCTRRPVFADDQWVRDRMLPTTEATAAKETALALLAVELGVSTTHLCERIAAERHGGATVADAVERACRP